MPCWKRFDSKISALLEILGWTSISASIFLVGFGSWVWAQETLTKTDALQNLNIAVLQTQWLEIARRVTAIEDRLFGVLLVSIGAVVPSITSSVFCIRIYRRLKPERMP